MASRHPSIRVVALAVSLAACTTGGQATEPTAPPDVFAPTPSIGDLGASTTTARASPTTIDVDRMVIYPADPSTLEALPGFDSIPMGDWTWGVTSPNGKWLALIYGDDTGMRTGLRLVDVPAWTVANEWSQLYSSPMTVLDDGTIYSISYAGESPQLIRVAARSEEVETIAELSPQFSTLDLPRLWNGQIMLAGQTVELTELQTTLSMVTADVSTGAINEVPLSGLRLGPAELVELGEGKTGVIDTSPALVWDERQGRLLIVHGTEDVVTELDLTTLEVSEHRFGPLTDESSGTEITSADLNDAVSWTSTVRSAALGPANNLLYMAGHIGEFAARDGSFSSITTPSGVAALDTTTWEIVDRLDAPISDLFISPDGRRLLAAGYTQESNETRSMSESAGLYVIDPVGLEVIAHHPPERVEQYLGPVSYSRDMTLAYVASYYDVDRVDVIDLDSGAIVSKRSSILVFGEVAVVAETVEPG